MNDIQKLKYNSLKKKCEFIKFYVEIYEKTDYTSYILQTDFCDTYQKAMNLKNKITYIDTTNYGIRIMVAYGTEEDFDINVFEEFR